MMEWHIPCFVLVSSQAIRFWYLQITLMQPGLQTQLTKSECHFCYFQAGKDFLLREYTSKEKKISELKGISPAKLTNPNEINEHLDVKLTEIEKLQLPSSWPKDSFSGIIRVCPGAEVFNTKGKMRRVQEKNMKMFKEMKKYIKKWGKI